MRDAFRSYCNPSEQNRWTGYPMRRRRLALLLLPLLPLQAACGVTGDCELALPCDSNFPGSNLIPCTLALGCTEEATEPRFRLEIIGNPGFVAGLEDDAEVMLYAEVKLPQLVDGRISVGPIFEVCGDGQGRQGRAYQNSFMSNDSGIQPGTKTLDSAPGEWEESNMAWSAVAEVSLPRRLPCGSPVTVDMYVFPRPENPACGSASVVAPPPDNPFLRGPSIEIVPSCSGPATSQELVISDDFVPVDPADYYE